MCRKLHTQALFYAITCANTLCKLFCAHGWTAALHSIQGMAVGKPVWAGRARPHPAEQGTRQQAPHAGTVTPYLDFSPSTIPHRTSCSGPVRSGDECDPVSVYTDGTQRKAERLVPLPCRTGTLLPLPTKAPVTHTAARAQRVAAETWSGWGPLSSSTSAGHGQLPSVLPAPCIQSYAAVRMPAPAGYKQPVACIGVPPHVGLVTYRCTVHADRRGGSPGIPSVS